MMDAANLIMAIVAKAMLEEMIILLTSEGLDVKKRGANERDEPRSLCHEIGVPKSAETRKTILFTTLYRFERNSTII
jgi:hypothetical protein